MTYTNSSNRPHAPGRAGSSRKPPTFLSLESGPRGLHLCVRTPATLVRRKAGAFKLATAAAVTAAFFGPYQNAKAQLGYDPFAGNASHIEARWTSVSPTIASYTDPSTGGTNRPTGLSGDAVNGTLLTATSFNFGVTSPGSDAFLIGGAGGNIYSFDQTLTLTLSSTYAPAVGAFNTVVFSIRVAGTVLDTASVSLTPNGGSATAPRFTSATLTGTGMSAVTQYAFQFDLSGIGGSNNFSIALPSTGSSSSFSSSQLDASTAALGAQSVVPEPSTTAAMIVGAGGLVTLLRRRLSTI